ncbi:MAG: CDP-alcohol phosphatidyltransferase family protein [Pseudomonadota bacterium]
MRKSSTSNSSSPWQQLPNTLTVFRLLLALPLGLTILQGHYSIALLIALAAGTTDLLDGYLARKLEATSRFGAALDPLADKLLITVSFLSFAVTGLVPWYLAVIVITRDLVIVTGALAYQLLIGPVELASRWLSKANMLIQIVFCAAVLMAQILPYITPATLAWGVLAVLAFAIASGLDYVLTWSVKAFTAGRSPSKPARTKGH